jgi:hypothetical protein
MLHLEEMGMSAVCGRSARREGEKMTPISTPTLMKNGVKPLK